MGVEINQPEEQNQDTPAPEPAVQQRNEPETFTDPVDQTPTGAAQQQGVTTYSDEGASPAQQLTDEELEAETKRRAEAQNKARPEPTP